MKDKVKFAYSAMIYKDDYRIVGLEYNQEHYVVIDEDWLYGGLIVSRVLEPWKRWQMVHKGHYASTINRGTLQEFILEV